MQLSMTSPACTHCCLSYTPALPLAQAIKCVERGDRRFPREQQLPAATGAKQQHCSHLLRAMCRSILACVYCPNPAAGPEEVAHIHFSPPCQALSSANSHITMREAVASVSCCIEQVRYGGALPNCRECCGRFEVVGAAGSSGSDVHRGGLVLSYTSAKSVCLP